MALAPSKQIACNNKARYEYFIQDTLEAGLVLLGSEVKSLRQGKVSIIEAHVAEVDGALCVLGMEIAKYDKARLYNHEPRRPRILLLHKNQRNKLLGQIKLKGFTAIPLKVYFNHKNIAKIELGVAKGKKQHDKRQAIKQREWERDKARLKKTKNL